jgi:hypothetical protein
VVADSLSAYNCGWRNVFGYGAVLPSGQYGNQTYVDSVLANVRYFESWEAQKVGARSGIVPVALLATGVVLALLAGRRRRRIP